MPAEMEASLKAEAAKKGLKGKHADAYVYGTMNNAGVMHGNKETAKGKKMDARGYNWRDRHPDAHAIMVK